MQKYTGIGLMSGTSLDGLDIACCDFYMKAGVVGEFDITMAESIEFPTQLKNSLIESMSITGRELTQLDLDLGSWIGEQCVSFLNTHKLRPDYIASHGHTVYHQPDQKMTLQIGNGNVIHAITKLPVIWDFRSLDIALGGQGAPLVPIGDQLLFPDYPMCVNLGGFANVSFDNGTAREAYDIGFNNIVLNGLANKLGKSFDAEGQIARSGELLEELSESLDRLDFYEKPYPKSVGKEWIEKEVLPLIDRFGHEKVENILHTITIHIASVIARDLEDIWKSTPHKGKGKTLITGGGVYNTFLIENINKKISNNIELVIPGNKLVEYKEALIFSLMGLLRLKGLNNCLKSVTGASRDSCSGVVSANNEIEINQN